MIAKVLNKDTNTVSGARNYDSSILTAIGMYIGVLVEVLLPMGVPLMAQWLSLHLRTKKV